VIQNQVDRGPGNDGRQLLHELDRLEEQMRGTIAPHRLEFDEDAPVGAEADAVLGEWGPEEVAAELLKAGAIVGGNPDVGVEVEAVEVGLTRAAGREVIEEAASENYLKVNRVGFGGRVAFSISSPLLRLALKLKSKPSRVLVGSEAARGTRSRSLLTQDTSSPTALREQAASCVERSLYRAPDRTE
jgi:hypothetical protein